MRFGFYFNHNDYIAQGEDVKCFAQTHEGWIGKKMRVDASFRPVYEIPEFWALKRAMDNNLSQATINRLEKAYKNALLKYDI